MTEMQIVNKILSDVYRHPLLSATDLGLICEAHTLVEAGKATLLLREGEVANAYYIVESGLVRTYVYDFEGNEITTAFAGDWEVVIEVASLFQRIPTREYIQCLSDARLWKISFERFQELFHEIPAFREWGRSWMAAELSRSKLRATGMITLPASERYLRLLEEKPRLLQQAPLKHIASYLGITDTSLSRIRKEITAGGTAGKKNRTV
ncbi:Crp/Fnr family transcriptional regulator [Sinomicrobium soli]|uniref:Crp/Fnr family transcriptional regulator n=1 Tax=Sinomicrobium sp. N-1-3-6 TaxID=2219864 RepID=UPI000DCE6666|nr:Crp/Fnr family transcriptional regulator [Sinomicrobium sp. N-1-3-6]RAV29068.1 hypothetical protein DN748_09080 [Sinomicrobium sp. N-1-3-6]